MSVSFPHDKRPAPEQAHNSARQQAMSRPQSSSMYDDKLLVFPPLHANPATGDASTLRVQESRIVYKWSIADHAGEKLSLRSKPNEGRGNREKSN
jgi:hypothetical protein